MRVTKKHKLGLPLFAAVFIFSSLLMSVFVNVLRPGVAHAAVQGVWTDVQTITVNGNQYVDSNWPDNNIDFKYTDGNGCTSEINGFHNAHDRVSDANNNSHGGVDVNNPTASDARSATITVSSVPTPGGGCVTQPKQTISLGDVGNRLATMRVVDAGMVEVLADLPHGSVKRGETFIQVKGAPGGGFRFYRQNELNSDGSLGVCNDYIVTGGDWTEPSNVLTAQLFEMNTDSSNKPAAGNPGCYLANGAGINSQDGTIPDIWISDHNNITLPAGTGTRRTQPNGSTNTKIGISCNTWSLNPLNWVLCPVVFGMRNAVNALDDAITNIMDIDVQNYFGNTTVGNSFYTVWSSIRNISLVILVIAALVMVISQAAGVGPFDAYTIKRVLPRLLIAVIFISLSWPILKLLIQFSDDLGKAVRYLIQAPFAQAGLKFNIGGGEFTFGAGAGLAALATIGSGIDIFGVLSLVFVGLLAVAIAFLVLVIRQIVVILLAVLAPVAIACYILPNTKKVYDVWWDFFIRALMAFPIIMAFITAGRVFAAVATSGTSGAISGTVGGIVGFIAYFGPYFALPYAFRLAGGAIATIGGVVNDRSKGLFDRNRKFRQERAAHVKEERLHGNTFRGGTQDNVRGKVNRGVQRAMLLQKAGFRPSRMGANLRTAASAVNFDAASKFMQENQAFQAFKNDDDKLWALTHGTSAESIRNELKARAPDRFRDPRSLDDAVSEVLRAQREGGVDVARIAAVRAQAATGTGFNYRDDGVEDDMLNAILGASGNDRTLAGRMLGEMKTAANQSGRIDLGGGGYAKQAQIMDKRRAALAGGPAYSAAEARRDVMEDVLNSNAGAAIAGKKRAVQDLAPVMKDRLDRVLAGGDTAAAARAFADLAGKYDAASQVAPQNAEVLATDVLSKEIDLTALPAPMRTMLAREIRPDGTETFSTVPKLTYQQAIERLRYNADFQTMRREYANAGIAAAARAAAAPPPGAGGAGTPPGGAGFPPEPPGAEGARGF